MTDQQLNEQVARKLGWKKLDKPDYSLSHPHYWKDDNAVLRDDVPNYCNSIEASWEIVEHVEHTFVLSRKYELWAAQWNPIGSDDPICQPIAAESDTAPRAICLAFLKMKNP